MGASQSATQVPSEDSQQEEEEEESSSSVSEDNHHQHEMITPNNNTLNSSSSDPLLKKILQQEPEMLPCHQSASPLSPQLSTYGTPRLGPSIKVWDPYNVLAPPQFNRRTFSDDSSSLVADDYSSLTTEVYLINHGECHMNLRPDLIAGRCPDAALTPNGKRQARALAVFLNSQGVRFTALYASPLDRARATALSLCQVVLLTYFMQPVFHPFSVQYVYVLTYLVGFDASSGNIAVIHWIIVYLSRHSLAFKLGDT